MKLQPNEIYHIYNRGNNRQPIFYDESNYRFFLYKVKKYLAPYCDILAYSLMPNHFHFMIHANEKTNIVYRRSNARLRYKRKDLFKLTLFSWGLQQLLSSYTKSINKKFNRTGSLFQQNTRYKRTSSENFLDDYSLWCFIYIHNNPKTAGLVSNLEEYEYASFKDFFCGRTGSICNISLAEKLLSFDLNELFQKTETEIPANIYRWFFKT